MRWDEGWFYCSSRKDDKLLKLYVLVMMKSEDISIDTLFSS